MFLYHFDIGKFHIGSNRTLQFTVNDTTTFITGDSVVNLTVNAIPVDFPNGTVFNLFSSGSDVSTSSNITFTLSSQVSQGVLSLPGTLSNNSSSTINLNNYVGLSTYDFFDSNFKSGLSIDHTGAFKIAGLDLSEGNISKSSFFFAKYELKKIAAPVFLEKGSNINLAFN